MVMVHSLLLEVAHMYSYTDSGPQVMGGEADCVGRALN